MEEARKRSRFMVQEERGICTGIQRDWRRGKLRRGSEGVVKEGTAKEHSIIP